MMFRDPITPPAAISGSPSDRSPAVVKPELRPYAGDRDRGYDQRKRHQRQQHPRHNPCAHNGQGFRLTFVGSALARDSAKENGAGNADPVSRFTRWYDGDAAGRISR
jgi:hypothetical protein